MAWANTLSYTKDYYGVLGVTSEADAVVIRAAYKALMTKYHPDRNPSPEALKISKSLTEAISILGDEVRRLDYDLHRLNRMRTQNAEGSQASSTSTTIPIDVGTLKDVFSPGSTERSRAILGGGGLLILLGLFFLAVSVA